MLVDGVLGFGFLGVSGFGVWRGQSLWQRHIELKHEREITKLQMQRAETAVRLEMEQTWNLAEIARQDREAESVPRALPPAGESGTFVAFTQLPFVCGCNATPAWHLHAMRENKPHVLPLSMGALKAIKNGNAERMCVCRLPVHAYDGGNGHAALSVDAAGYVVRR